MQCLLNRREESRKDRLMSQCHGVQKIINFEVDEGDTWFLPVGHNSHWFLLRVNVPTRTISCFDSFNDHSGDPATAMAELTLLVNETLSSKYPLESWSDWNHVYHTVPKQVDGWNCGPLTLLNLCLLLRGRPLLYQMTDMTSWRRVIAYSVYSGKLVDF
jgi:Ulp1 family protease